jgi:DNA-binding response OmpR family regulator
MPAPRKILLVDDDPLFAGMIALLFSGFRSERFILDHAADQASGRERLRSGEYALCLLDYHLGDGESLLCPESRGEPGPAAESRHP